MRTIAHISDLHFGTEDPAVTTGLLQDLLATPPDLLLVSGDLTQRARRSQFIAARNFLDALPFPRIVVPGNHDIPLDNLLARLLFPLSGFRRHITPEPYPQFVDEELAVLGINTARPGTWKEGRISLLQIVEVRRFFGQLPPSTFKILVAHHPFAPPGNVQTSLIGGVDIALKALEDCGCDMILTGHLHHAYRGDVRAFHTQITRSMLILQAGTAVSRRRRNEANSYNRITLTPDELRLEVRSWNDSDFNPTSQARYRKSPQGWHPDS